MQGKYNPVGTTVIQSSRRSFVGGVGFAALAALGAISRRASAETAKSSVATPFAIQDLVEQERRRIRDAMARQDIPGAAVCLMYQGKPAWIEGFGVTDRTSNRRIEVSTIFSTQSTSKNFTAVAIMLAVQRGLLDLDRPISAYLPNLTVRSRLESAPQEKMTLRLLLSHRAGFTHEAPVGNNYDPAFPDFEAHVRSISRTWLRYPVGERYRYSNLGIDLAGYILQVVCKAPFAELLKKTIFDPLGMADSTAATEVYARCSDRAIGHEQGYAAVPLRIPLIPSGGVYTSARDMAAYLSFHLNRGKFAGKTILDESLWSEMHGFSLGGDYGLGVIRTELRYGNTSIRTLDHKGGGFGFGCVCSYCPQAELAWVAVFNRPTDAAYQFGATLQHELLTRRYGVRTPKLPARDFSPVQLESKQLQQFIGSYVGRASICDIKLENGVMGMRVGASFTPVQFTSPVDMFIVDSEGEAVTYRYFPGDRNEAAHFECSIGEKSLDYNDAPLNAAGPNSSEWEPYLGPYLIEQWGKQSRQVIVRRRNGYLYLDEIRLTFEFEKGLFFTSDGEAVDFRQSEPTWRNIRLHRTATPHAQTRETTRQMLGPGNTMSARR
jgi:CubicO group peptidase (beta-lactamase class C family)